MKKADERVKVRLLQDEDIPFAMELKNIAGWNQVEDDWRRYMQLEPEGCFLADVDGEMAGTATGISYDRHLGWVGMILVHPSKRRLGVGTTLLHTAVDYLQGQGVAAVKLDATPMGKKVYVPLGFEDEYAVTRYEGTARRLEIQGATEHAAPIRPADIMRISQWDRQYFGVSRKAVLCCLCEQEGAYAFCIEQEGQVRGYIMAHPGHEAIQIGPWVADHAQVAEHLLARLFSKIEGRRVFLDVPEPNASGTELVKRCGFAVQRGFDRMCLGDNAHPGEPEHIYATSSPEKG